MKLFPSTLVIGGSDHDIANILTTLGHQVTTNNPDIFEVSEYTIDNVRKINRFLSQKPYSHQSKIILIKNADSLQVEAQNALLKNLEEPGENNYFILTTDHPNSLLPTILSRCHSVQSEFNQNNPDKILIIPTTLVEKLSLSESLAVDKLSTVTYLENQLRLFQQKLVHEPTPENTHIIKKIIKSIALIKANVDPKTALDYLLLS